MLVKWLGEKVVRAHGFNLRPSDVASMLQRVVKEG